MQMQQKQMAALIQALIGMGHIDAIVAANVQPPSAYEFGVDLKSDAKLVPGMLRTAYTAVCGAALREARFEKPLFDDEEEDRLQGTGAEPPPAPMTLEEAKHYASAVYRVAVSYSNTDEGRWLRNRLNKKAMKDDEGEYQVVTTVINAVKPFSEWLIEQLETTPVESNWFVALLEVRRLGTDVPLYADGINEAKVVFDQWLNDTPWNRDELVLTRKERTIAKTGNNKWKAFLNAVNAGLEVEAIKVLGDWPLLCHSPDMAAMIERIKVNPVYIMYSAEAEMDKQEAILLKQELKLNMLDLREKIAKRSAELDARMAAMEARTAPVPEAEKPKGAGEVGSVTVHAAGSTPILRRTQ